MTEFLFTFLILSIIGNVYFIIIAKRKLRKIETLYMFCERRRELMIMAYDKKLNVNSFTFKYFYKQLSYLIRYSDRYNFSSRSFLKKLSESIDNDEIDKVIVKLDDEIKNHHDPKAVKNFIIGFSADGLYAFYKNSLLYKYLVDNVIRIRNAQTIYRKITGTLPDIIMKIWNPVVFRIKTAFKMLSSLQLLKNHYKPV